MVLKLIVIFLVVLPPCIAWAIGMWQQIKREQD